MDIDLIYYRGLNCRLAGIINIANLLGMNYLDTYATLWSETHFIDEKKYNIYVSKRILTNLEKLGLVIETLDCNEIKAAEKISQIPIDELLLIGMDTFYIPWHRSFNFFHDRHYFFAKKVAEYSVLCFDPVYNEKNIILNTRDILPAFELSRVYKLEIIPSENALEKEAQEVLRSHSHTKDDLLDKIRKSKNEGKNSIIILIKQISAMINNRYLFKHFLDNSELILGRQESFFNEAYFLKWEAVRNGLYKSIILHNNESAINEVCNIFTALMSEEIDMAKNIIDISLTIQENL